MFKLNIDHAIQLIPEFDGNKKHLNRFLYCCEECFNQMGGDETSKKLLFKIMTMKLKGIPFEVVSKRQPEKFVRFQQFEQVVRISSSLSSRFKYFKQPPLENNNDYTKKARKLFEDLNAAVEPNAERPTPTPINNQFAISAYLKGLRKRLNPGNVYIFLEDAVDAVKNNRN